MTPESIIIINSYGSVNGGATRVAIDEAVGLADRGIEVTFLASVGPISDELRSKRLRVLCLGQRDLSDLGRSPTVALQALWNSSAYSTIRTLLRRSDRRKTIVHAHGFSQAMSASPITAALQAGFATVCTLHDYFLVCPNGGFFDFPSATECHLQPMSLACVMRNCDRRSYSHKLYRLLKTGFQRHACGIPKVLKNYIALSSSAAARIRPYLPPDARLFRLPNPCLVPKLPAVDLRHNRELVVIGHLNPEKGIELLLRACEIAKRRILFIGDGPLRGQAEAKGFNEVTGWLSRTAVLQRLEAARCLVFPSLLPETFGLTVMDAAARGIPAIVTNIAGIAEHVEDGVTGWHIRPGDVTQLVDRLRATNDTATVAAMGAAAYAKYWQAPFGPDRHIDDLLKIYTTILSSESSTRARSEN